MRFLSLSVLCILLWSCIPSNQFDLKQLNGKWHENQLTYEWIEEWKVIDGETLEGSGTMIKNGESILIENLRLYHKDGKKVYVAQPINQNNGAEIEFALTSESANSMHFENPAHDFPQFVHYEVLDPNHLDVRIGLLPMKKDSTEMVFHFERIQ